MASCSMDKKGKESVSEMHYLKGISAHLVHESQLVCNERAGHAVLHYVTVLFNKKAVAVHKGRNVIGSVILLIGSVVQNISDVIYKRTVDAGVAYGLFRFNMLIDYICHDRSDTGNSTSDKRDVHGVLSVVSGVIHRHYKIYFRNLDYKGYP